MQIEKTFSLENGTGNASHSLSNSLTEEEVQLLQMVSERPNLLLNELSSHIQKGDALTTVRALVAKGYLALLVVTYIWGVEFKIELTERGHNYVNRPEPDVLRPTVFT